MAEEYTKSQKFAMQQAKDAEMDRAMRAAAKRHKAGGKGPRVKGPATVKGRLKETK